MWSVRGAKIHVTPRSRAGRRRAGAHADIGQRCGCGHDKRVSVNRSAVRGKGRQVRSSRAARRKASVDARNNSMTTALHCAASSGHLEICKLLLQKGADVRALDEDQGQRAGNGQGRGPARCMQVSRGSARSSGRARVTRGDGERRRPGDWRGGRPRGGGRVSALEPHRRSQEAAGPPQERRAAAPPPGFPPAAAAAAERQEAAKELAEASAR